MTCVQPPLGMFVLIIFNGSCMFEKVTWLSIHWAIPFNSLTLYRPYTPYGVFDQFPQTTVYAMWRISHPSACFILELALYLLLRLERIDMDL